MGLTTPHMLLNLGRAMQSQWEVQLQADGSFNFCDRKFGLLSFGVNALNAKFQQVAISLVPSEHNTAFSTITMALRMVFSDYATCSSAPRKENAGCARKCKISYRIPL